MLSSSFYLYGYFVSRPTFRASQKLAAKRANVRNRWQAGAGTVSWPCMNFFQFLKSLDDLLYEVVSWLAFYPITMWRTIRHPIAMMEYASAELDKPDEQRFDDALSPPILLLLTVLVAHGIELAAVGQSRLVTETSGFAGLISDDTSLILLRLVAFASFPLIFAVHTVRKLHVPLTRSSLECPFFAQCYANAPFALLLSLCATLLQVPDRPIQLLALILSLLGVIGFIAVQTAWFRKALNVGLGVGLWNAFAGYFKAGLFLIPAGWLIGGATW